MIMDHINKIPSLFEKEIFMSQIKFGWSEVSLVPQGKKVDLAGQFYERITDVVEDEITVTALAMECGEDSAVGKQVYD